MFFNVADCHFKLLYMYCKREIVLTLGCCMSFDHCLDYSRLMAFKYRLLSLLTIEMDTIDKHYAISIHVLCSYKT